MRKFRVCFFVLIVLLPCLLMATGEAEKAVDSNDSLKGDLVYWSNWNGTEPQGQVISRAIKEFEKLHPNVHISVVWNGRENRKVLLPALESGKQIDFFEQTCDLVLGRLKEYLLDLEPYYNKAYPTTDGEVYIDTLMPAAVELMKSFSPEGGIYAVPYQPNLFGIFYNKEHFEKAGITEVPETWEEFQTVCEKLKKAGYTPMTSDDAYLINLIGAHIERVKGQDWLRANIKHPEILFADPEVAKGFEALQSMMNKGYFSEYILSNKYPAGQQDMVINDEISMYYNGSWLPNELKGSAGPDFRWGVFNYPVINAAVSDAGHVQYNSQALAINKNCKYPEAAFEFAVFLTSGKWDKTLSDETLGIPVSKGKSWPAQLDEAKPIFDQIDYRVTGDYGLFAVPEYNPIIIETFCQILSGSKSVQEGMSSLMNL